MTKDGVVLVKVFPCPGKRVPTPRRRPRAPSIAQLFQERLAFLEEKGEENNTFVTSTHQRLSLQRPAGTSA